MPAYLSDQIGSDDEAVRVLFDDRTTQIFEAYEVTNGIFSQPSAFSVQLGWGDSVRELILKLHPNTKFALSIGGVKQQSGRTDGYRVPGNGGAAVVHLRGRDAMAPIHDGYVPADTTFASKSYKELVVAAMKAVGHEGRLLLTDTNARNTRTGVTVRVGAEPKSADETAVDRGRKGSVTPVIKAHCGETWLSFLTRELAHAGLFLWATPTGDLVLSRPAVDQAPTYRIYRSRDRRAKDQTNITDWDFANETTRRFSQVGIFSRSGGKKSGNTKVRGAFEDEEMIAWGFNRPLVRTEASVPDGRSAELVARRRLAETRRDGFQLRYTVAGHKTDALSGGRAVWAPNTIVDLFDEDLGLSGKWWIERVTFRSPPTTTELVLVRTSDLFFEGGE